MSTELATVDTIGAALPREMTRVRAQVVPAYEAVGSAGAFALLMIRQSLTRADRAIVEGDVVAMIRCYEDLKGYGV